MFGAPREVNELFRMAQRKTSTTAYVSSVGGRTRISCVNGLCHGRIADDSSPSSVADALKLAVPAVNREPNFNFDVGVTRGFDSYGHTAEVRKFFVGIGTSCALPFARRRELSGWYDLSHCDSCVLQRNLGQAIAR